MLLDEAAPAAPEVLRHWRLQQSLALLRLGQFQEAEAELAGLDEVPPEIRPLFLWRRLLLAVARQEPDQALRLAGEMAQTCETMGPRAVPSTG